MPYKIITHDGKAHMDELLASALLALHLGEEPVSIERINSQEAAKMLREGAFDDSTYLIDCGMIHDSARKLFDHHQNKESGSSALLIFNEFFPHLKETDLYEYIQLVSKVDTKGAMSLDDFEEVNETRDYLKFTQGIILRSFADDPLSILRIFIAGLKDKIEFEQLKKEAEVWLSAEGNIEITAVENLNILRYLKRPPEELVSPLRSVSGTVVDEHEVAAILSFDDKVPEALSFYRTDTGHDLLDFSKSEPAEKIFSHFGGFLMKFIPADDDEWKRLLQEAKTEV